MQCGKLWVAIIFQRFTFVAIIGLCGAHSTAAQVFQHGANNPGNLSFHTVPYPVVFVASPIKLVANPQGGVTGTYKLGTDVLSAPTPSGGNELWILLPNGVTKKLFPLPVHHATPGLIDTPSGRLTNASVVEPNMSEDGRAVYFTFFHDADDLRQQSQVSARGADLYKVDLSALLDNTNADPAALPVKRLTFRTYQSNGTLSTAERFKDALNPMLAASYVNDWGTIYMHAIEMRTATGLKLVYVSNERRVQNSNNPMTSYTNHNFNLHIADIAPDGSLKNNHQAHYYTTTSALSPNPMRDGFAFSYQASTEDGRHWQAQGITSSGQWYPILGYGINPGLIHLGSFCVSTKAPNQGDYFVGARYYNQNNEGFGSLWTLDLSHVGLNEYDVPRGSAIVPRQVGSEQITLGVSNEDDPSPTINGEYLGKFTAPRCGRPNELFFAYTRTSANGRLHDAQNNKSIYNAIIGFRPNLRTFHPLATPSYSNETGILKIIEDSSKNYNLIWPTPVLDWQARTGDAQQRFSEPVDGSATSVPSGMPHAEVGTSALWNTDRKPFDCWLGPGRTPWSPNKAHNNINQENDLLHANQDGLTFVQNKGNFCEDLAPASVFGVAIHLTNNKIKTSALNYHTSNQGVTPPTSTQAERVTGDPREVSRLLGVYSVVNQSDQSFKAKIPAQVPFDFHLLHRLYGLKLTDVRSWHSLQAGEQRTNCGGCHDHRPGKAIPFAGTYADSRDPLDMVNQTTYVDYDPLCNPTVKTSEQASLPLPEWRADIWPQFNQNCGSCHNSLLSSDALALQALSFTNELEAWNMLKTRNYASPLSGAIGSQAWWAARRMRTDGRDNNLAKYVPNYSAGQWGYRFSSVHATLPGLCDGTDAAKSRWVYKFGQWIDHHMPRDTAIAGLFTSNFDTFHPTVSSGLVDSQCGLAGALRVGFWDDSGSVARLEIFVNGLSRVVHNALPNGSIIFPLTGLGSADSIRLLVEDGAGNRQMYAKSIDELVIACQVAAGFPAPARTPTPPAASTATPIPTPNTTAIPTPIPDATAPATPPTSSTPPPNGPPTSVPTQPPSPVAQTLDIQPKVVSSGEKVTLRVSFSSHATWFKVYCTTTGLRSSFVPGDLALKASGLLKRSAKWAALPLTNGTGTANILVPYSRRSLNQTITCQTTANLPKGLSNPASFTIKPPISIAEARRQLRASKSILRQHTAQCREIRRQTGIPYSKRLEIPVCRKAERLKQELMMGTSLKP